jgi:hypothetical protein
MRLMLLFPPMRGCLMSRQGLVRSHKLQFFNLSPVDHNFPSWLLQHVNHGGICIESTLPRAEAKQADGLPPAACQSMWCTPYGCTT